MKTIINYLTIIFLTGALWQCTPQNAAEETHGHDEHGAGHSDEHGDEEGNEHGDEHVGEEGEAMVILSDVQIASAGITTGTFDTMNVSGSVNANGVFDLPPDNIAAVNAPMAGIVRKANYLIGSYVKKGAELVVMEHPEFIKLQEEYLAVLSSLGYLEAEYKRQQTLDSANIAARKIGRAHV